MVNRKTSARAVLGAAIMGACGCNVTTTAKGTGGVDAGGGGACESALAVVCTGTDYTSTNVAVTAADGTPQSGSFVSTGSAAPGLSLALSGDVVVPFVPPASGRVVLLDRNSAVVTFMSLASAKVLDQLSVGTGFAANPHDYVEVDAKRAYVTRFASNPTPGQQPNDAGGDVLIVDTEAYTVLGRIAIPEENPALQPNPDAMNWLGDDVVVTLGRDSADFSQVGDGRFVGIAPGSDSVAWTVDVTGLTDCGRVVVSPSGKTAAIACTGQQDMTTESFVPAHSDIVIYDVTQRPPVEKKRLGAGVALGSAIQPSLAFATDDVLFGLTYGGNASPGDGIFTVSVSTGAVTTLGSATMPYELSDVRCSPGCADVCFVADAEKNVLRRWQVGANGALTGMADVSVDPTVGYLPRVIGGLL